jgi:NADH dehydrogenase
MILVTGGAGVMGSRLVRGLCERGEKVRVLTLPNDPYVNRLDGLDVEVFYGDVSDASTLGGAFDGVKTIYHLAAVLIAKDPAVFERVNVGGTRNMIEGGAKHGCEHFILVSSISVTYPYTTPYSLSKRECERLVKEQTAMKWTIVRPTLAYNENGGEEFKMFWDSLTKYPVVPFVGGGRAVKKPVHVDDLMAGFLAIPGNPKSYGKTYAFCGGEEISMRDMAKLMLERKGGARPFLPVPLPLCKLIAVVMAKAMKRPPLTWNAIAGVSQDANPSCEEARADLGYNPVGFREGMDRSYPRNR